MASCLDSILNRYHFQRALTSRVDHPVPRAHPSPMATCCARQGALKVTPEPPPAQRVPHPRPSFHVKQGASVTAVSASRRSDATIVRCRPGD